LEANKFLVKKTETTETLIAEADAIKNNTTEEDPKIGIVDTVIDETTSGTNNEGMVDSNREESNVVVEDQENTNIEEDAVTETSVAVEDQEDINRREEQVIEEVAETNTTADDDEATINPLYFGFDKFNITAKAAKELDKIANILNNNNNIHIEVSSYTDSRGSNAYNIKLSERRAKASADYLVALGVDRSRITTKGFGESKLVNKCFDGIECSEAAHEKNRRTEFTFLNPQAEIQTTSNESKAIKESEEEVIETIIEDTSVAKEKELVDDKTTVYADTEESTDESFSEIDEGQQKPTSVIEKEKPITEEVTVKDNTNPSTKKVDGFPISQDESSKVVSNGLSEEEKQEVLSFQESESSQKEVATETKIEEPASQRNAFNELIAEAEVEGKQEEKVNKEKNSTKKTDNSVPNKLATEIKNQGAQSTTEPVDKKEKLAKKVVNEKTLQVSTATINALQNKKGKYIETDKAKKIHALRVIFRIKENYLASRGAKDAFIVIRSPKGKVISEKGTFTLVNGDEQAYTDTTTIYFNSQSIKVVMFIDKIIHKFTKGTYTMDVYTEGHLVASNTLSLQ